MHPALFRHTAVALLTAGAAVSAHAQAPEWEDKPIGATWTPGMSTLSTGVKVNFKCFQWAPPAGVTCGGYAEVAGPTPGCNVNHKLILNNCNAELDFGGSIGPQTDVYVSFGEYGGNINISVNGDFRNIGNMIAVDGMMIGGCLVRVLGGGYGNDCGKLAVLGTVNQLMLGGQEFFIDSLEAPSDECDYGFEDLVPLDVLPLGASHAAGPESIATAKQLIHPVSGPLFNVVRVRASTLACSTGNEVEVNNAQVEFRPSTPGAQYERFSLKFYEASGGVINLSVNGDLRIGNNFKEFDGLVIGGALVSVPYGGFGDDCGQLIVEGTFNSIAVGGQQFYIDCLHDDIKGLVGDLNGDGKVNGIDLAQVLSSWGTANGDITGDQKTDGMDLAALLSNWT
jgi:hypothetical protein